MALQLDCECCGELDDANTIVWVDHLKMNMCQACVQEEWSRDRHELEYAKQTLYEAKRVISGWEQG